MAGNELLPALGGAAAVAAAPATGGLSLLAPAILGGLELGSSILGGLGSTSTTPSTYQTSGTNFPVNFLNQYTQYGPQQSNPYILGQQGSLPQGQSLFGFGGRSGPAQPPPPLPPLQYDPDVEPTIGYDDLAISYVGQGGDRRKLADLARLGFRPGEQYTLDQVRQIALGDSGTGPGWASARSQESLGNMFAAAEGLITLENERRRIDQQNRTEYDQLYGPDAQDAQGNLPSPYSSIPQEVVQSLQAGTATGQTWNPRTQTWDQVSGQPDLLYSGYDDTVYYRGQPVTDQNQLSQLLSYGPAAAGIAPSQLEVTSGIVGNLTGPPPQIDLNNVPYAGFTRNDPTQFSQDAPQIAAGSVPSVNPTAYQQSPGAYANDPFATQIDPSSFRAPIARIENVPQASESGLTINAPSVNAEYAQAPPEIFAPTIEGTEIDYSFDQEYLDALTNQRALPATRELDRRERETLAESEAMAAQRGLAGAGAWMAGERDYIKREHLNQVRSVYTDATNQAVTQFFGEKLQTALTQATLDQERRLAQAGFDFNAQTENARNILTTNITNAELGTRARVAEAELRVRADTAALDALTRIRTANLGAATNAALADLDARVRTNIANLNGQIQIADLNATVARDLLLGNQDSATRLALSNVDSATRLAGINVGVAGDLARANLTAAKDIAMGNQQTARDLLLANQSAEVSTSVGNMMTWANLAGVNMNTIVASQNNMLGLLQEMGRDVRALNEYDLEAASILTGQNINILGQIAGAGQFRQNITTSPGSSSSGLSALFG